MAYLLDTQVFIWFAAGDKRLSDQACSFVENTAIEKYISIASIWEMAIKSSIGKLQFEPDFSTFVQEEIDLIGYQVLSLKPSHTFRAEQLPFHHRDPFDRIIIAQALEEQLPVVTADVAFDLYGVKRIWD